MPFNWLKFLAVLFFADLSSTLALASNSAPPLPTGEAVSIALVGPQSVNTSSCTPYILQFLDAKGNPVTPIAPHKGNVAKFNYAISVKANHSGKFFTDDQCSPDKPFKGAKLFPSSQTLSLQPIYFQAPTKAVNVKASVRSSHLKSTSLAISVTSPVQPPPPPSNTIPAHLFLAGPPNVVQGYCAGPFIVSLWDVNYYPVILSPNTPALLQPDQGQFYSDENCTSPINQTTMVSYEGSPLIYFMVPPNANGSNMVNLVVSSPGLFSVSEQDAVEIVQPGLNGTVAVEVQGPASVVEGTCNDGFEIGFLAADGQYALPKGNVTVQLQADQGQFFLDDSCTTPVQQVTYNPSGNNLPSPLLFYQAANQVGTENMTASSPGLQPIPNKINVLKITGTPLSVKLTGPNSDYFTTTFPAGHAICCNIAFYCGPFTFQFFDANGNPYAPNTSAVITANPVGTNAHFTTSSSGTPAYAGTSNYTPGDQLPSIYFNGQVTTSGPAATVTVSSPGFKETSFPIYEYYSNCDPSGCVYQGPSECKN